ncbi:hypothetical protein ABKN59_009762 [Abortiporus biennis]
MAFREGHTEYYADCGTNHVVNPLRGMRVFTTLANMCCDPRNYPDIKNPSILNAYNNGSLSPRWQQLIKTIQTMIRSKFTDLFFRNNWFQQSISIADDIDRVIECNNLTQLIAESLDDALENLLLTGWFNGTISIKDIPTFFPGGDSDPGALDINVAIRILMANTLTYCFHSVNDIYIVLDLPQLDIQNCVDITLEDYDILHNKRMQSSREPLLLQKFTLGTSVYTPTERVDPNPVILDWLKWTSTPTSLLFLRILAGHFFDMIPSFGRHIQFLNIMFNEDSRVTVEDKIDKISFGADVLPSLKTLVVVLLDSGQSKTVRTFCKSLSRTSPSSTLSCVRVWTHGGFTSEGHKDLENTLGQLPINVRIEMMDGPYWSKLGSKMMLYIPTAPWGH